MDKELKIYLDNLNKKLDDFIKATNANFGKVNDKLDVITYNLDDFRASVSDNAEFTNSRLKVVEDETKAKNKKHRFCIIKKG